VQACNAIERSDPLAAAAATTRTAQPAPAPTGCPVLHRRCDKRRAGQRSKHASGVLAIHSMALMQTCDVVQPRNHMDNGWSAPGTSVTFVAAPHPLKRTAAGATPDAARTTQRPATLPTD
jgi:hypothetical protein